MTKSRDEEIEIEATKRAERQCYTGNDALQRAVEFYLKVGFEGGAKWADENPVLSKQDLICKLKAERDCYREALEFISRLQGNPCQNNAREALAKYARENGGDG